MTLEMVGSGLAFLGLLMSHIKPREKGLPKYSRQWIDGLSDSEWETEREKVRQQQFPKLYGSFEKLGGMSYNEAHRIVNLFDESKRAKQRAEDDGRELPIRHREHGYYLPDDD